MRTLESLKAELKETKKVLEIAIAEGRGKFEIDFLKLTVAELQNEINWIS